MMEVHDDYVRDDKNDKKRHRLLKKAPDAPKRFKSAYICFVMDKMDSLKSIPGDLKVTDKINFLANEWRELPLVERMKYEEQAKLDKHRYHKEMAMYTGPLQVPNKRLKKHPNAPKRAMSAFLSFSQQKRPFVKAKYPDAKNTDISCLLAQEWRAATEEERKPHIERELREREKYHENMAAWKQGVSDGSRVDGSTSEMVLDSLCGDDDIDEEDGEGMNEISQALKKHERIASKATSIGGVVQAQTLLSSSTNLWAELTNANASLGADLFPPDSWNHEFSMFGESVLDSYEDSRKLTARLLPGTSSSGNGSRESNAWDDFVSHLKATEAAGVMTSHRKSRLFHSHDDLSVVSTAESSSVPPGAEALVPVPFVALTRTVSIGSDELPQTFSSTLLTAPSAPPPRTDIDDQVSQASRSLRLDSGGPDTLSIPEIKVAPPAESAPKPKPKPKVVRKAKLKAKVRGPPSPPHYQALDTPPGLKYPFAGVENSVYQQLGLFRPSTILHSFAPSSSAASPMASGSAAVWSAEQFLMLRGLQQQYAGSLPMSNLYLQDCPLYMLHGLHSASTGLSDSTTSTMGARLASGTYDDDRSNHSDGSCYQHYGGDRLPSGSGGGSYVYEDANGNPFFPYPPQFPLQAHAAMMPCEVGADTAGEVGLGSSVPAAVVESGNRRRRSGTAVEDQRGLELFIGMSSSAGGLPQMHPSTLVSSHHDVPCVPEQSHQQPQQPTEPTATLPAPRSQFDRGSWKDRFGGGAGSSSSPSLSEIDARSIQGGNSGIHSLNTDVPSSSLDPGTAIGAGSVVRPASLLDSMLLDQEGRMMSRSKVLAQLESSLHQLNVFDAAMRASLYTSSVPENGSAMLSLSTASHTQKEREGELIQQERERKVIAAAVRECDGHFECNNAVSGYYARVTDTLAAAAGSGFYSQTMTLPTHWTSALGASYSSSGRSADLSDAMSRPEASVVVSTKQELYGAMLPFPCGGMVDAESDSPCSDANTDTPLVLYDHDQGP